MRNYEGLIQIDNKRKQIQIDSVNNYEMKQPLIKLKPGSFIPIRCQTTI
jgi:hypothetical protein